MVPAITDVEPVVFRRSSIVAGRADGEPAVSRNPASSRRVPGESLGDNLFGFPLFAPTGPGRHYVRVEVSSYRVTPVEGPPRSLAVRSHPSSQEFM